MMVRSTSRILGSVSRPAHTSPPPPGPRRRALIGWRVLALVYDTMPVVALWLLVGAAFAVGYLLAGHPPRENIRPFSALQWSAWLCCWLVTGAYAVLSWRRGGQTLGMRPWRLYVTAADDRPAGIGALCLRYVIGTISLLAGGLGFWWAWLDHDRLTLHDRLSGTRMQRRGKHSQRLQVTPD